MKKNNLKIVKIDKNKTLFNYEKKILINELILDLKLGYYHTEKGKSQKVKFNLEVNYENKKPSNDKDIKSIVNYAKIVRLIKKLIKNKHYNFLETLAEDVFDELFKDKRIVISEDFKINGKNCVMKGNDWEEKVSERKNGGHEMNHGLCFQYYNPVILDYIASRIK